MINKYEIMKRVSKMLFIINSYLHCNPTRDNETTLLHYFASTPVNYC